MYRQLEQLPGFSRSLRPMPTAAYACPVEQQAASAQPPARRESQPCELGSRTAVKVPKLLEDLSGHWRAHCRAAGLGPRVRHHRFSDAARSEGDFAGGAQPLSGSADAMSLRRFRRAVALVIALVLCMIRFWLMRLRGPLTLERRARCGCNRRRRHILDSLGIEYRVEGQPPHARTGGLESPELHRHSDSVGGDAVLFCGQDRDWRLAVLRQGGAVRGHDFCGPVEPGKRQSVAEQMTERLKLPIPIPVLLFPEGTSTDGSEVIAFSLAADRSGDVAGRADYDGCYSLHGGRWNAGAGAVLVWR